MYGSSSSPFVNDDMDIMIFHDYYDYDLLESSLSLFVHPDVCVSVVCVQIAYQISSPDFILS